MIRRLKWKLLNCYPRIYRKHWLIPSSWGLPKRDLSGHWWVDFGRYVLTTSPK